jgi:hypothetical protein
MCSATSPIAASDARLPTAGSQTAREKGEHPSKRSFCKPLLLPQSCDNAMPPRETATTRTSQDGNQQNRPTFVAVAQLGQDAIEVLIVDLAHREPSPSSQTPTQTALLWCGSDSIVGVANG